MKMYKIKQEIPNTGSCSDVYVGLDIHQKSWHVSIVCDGVLVMSTSMPAQWDALRRLLDRYTGHRIHAVYEAGYFGYGLYDRLIEYGAECIVTPPNMIPQESGNRVKTDRIDSKKLAVLFSRGLLKSIVVPSPEERSHQTVLRRRHQLVGDRVRVQLRIKAELRYYDIPFPPIQGRWSKTFVENLHHLHFQNRWLSESFKRLLDEYDHLSMQIEQQTRLVQALATTDRYRNDVALLRTIPGIGILTAMEILVELQNIHRFRNGGALTAYVGLTPSQYSSGEHVRMGRITRSGKGYLRTLLVEASWVLVNKDPVMKEKYQTLKYRAGAKKAIVAIARRLLIRARRVLLDQSAYVCGKAA